MFPFLKVRCNLNSEIYAMKVVDKGSIERSSMRDIIYPIHYTLYHLPYTLYHLSYTISLYPIPFTLYPIPYPIAYIIYPI